MGPTVEERLETLEEELRRLSARVGALDAPSQSATEASGLADAGDCALMAKLRQQGIDIPDADAWRQTIGWAKGLCEHDEAAEAGTAWRAEANQTC
jgi:hypothetical protein